VEIDRESQRLVEKGTQAKTISATSKANKYFAEFFPRIKMIKTSGIITTDNG